MITKKNVAISILINSHICGIIGLISPYKELFLILTPINLIISTILLFIYQKDFSRQFLVFAALIFLLGYLVELIGVKTGQVFGEYEYGETLGLKIFSIPIIMGLNWLNLIYCVGIVMNKYKINNYLKSCIGAAILTCIDFFLEPVAIKNDFWIWNSTTVPIQNYVAWFVFSFIFLLIFQFLKFNKTNKLAMPFIVIQFLFFFILCFFQ